MRPALQNHKLFLPSKKMKLIKSLTAFTLIELLVVITIIGILAAIAIPAIGGAVDKAKLTQAQSSLSGITKIVALIGIDADTGDTNVSKYPSTNLTFWYKSLTNYAGTNDLMKMFSAGDIKATSWNDSGPNVSAYYVYAVSDDSPGDAIMMSSKNWLVPTSGNGPALVSSAKPFGDKGALILKKSSAVQIINSRQATNDISNFGISTNCLN
jgi:prepilin-type N-terminal cleavage/methylation domain-containing protein